MKILFIEDDRSRNRPLVNYLEDYKRWEVIWEETPGSAMERLKQEKGIDVILIDIMMPYDGSLDEKKCEMGMSTGIVLIDEIKKIRDNIPIIVLSARKDLQWLVKDKKVMSYLRKPMSADEVIEAIEKVVKGK